MPYMITILTCIKEIACIYACPIRQQQEGYLRTQILSICTNEKKIQNIRGRDI